MKENMKWKYKRWDIVFFWERSLFCRYFPKEVELCSNVHFWLFGKYYFYRENTGRFNWIPNFVTKKVYERQIEELVPPNK